MPDWPAILDIHLSNAYREQVLGRAPSSTRLTDALQADADLRSEAQRELARLTDSVTRKCFISQTRKRLLTDALERIQ